MTVPDGVPMRWCKGHQCEHPESEFYVKDGKTGRLDNFCKAIRQAQKNARYAADPEWHRAEANGLASMTKEDPEWVAVKRAEREALARQHRQKVDPTKPRVCVGPCGLLKPPEAYRDNRRQCKACDYLVIKTGQKEADARYKALHPGLRKLISRRHYWKDPAKARLRARQQRAANPSKHVSYVLKWQRNNPELRISYVRQRRARRRNAEGSFSSKEWLALKAQYEYTCLWCRRKEPEIKLSPDHIIALSRGGTDWIGNIQPLCWDNGNRKSSCQYRKHTHPVDLRPFWPGPLPEYVELPDGSLFMLRMPV